MHYSVSREDYLVDHTADVAPDHAGLLKSGHKKQKLRAHSDFYWNPAVTDWALSFWSQFDIQCESKGKNLASEQVYNRAVELGLT
jgi:UV DNA damage endonuclease